MSLSASFRIVPRYAVDSPHALPSAARTPQILPRNGLPARPGRPWKTGLPVELSKLRWVAISDGAVGDQQVLRLLVVHDLTRF
jgi:hypothetical protein